ncbi:centrosome and spindle pole-associated protein 1 [Lingula anatina]|uniref:Centrosome and spindle pole-associated protein 1 n=1 Tax=Lingula anatina TaxID=7574 RepID=A0A1S3K1K2_LINAN|nr:centrosome and spindle pole-associated protein 1 [Lingula anatina]|eukprot:XP_013416513.1 centrosome and spindle pole-associated protein 1 [Lingula anatina]
MADDIEYFIQQQKQKLAAERRSLGQEPDRDDPNTSRRTWDRTPKSNLDEQILQHGRRGPQDRQTEDVEGGTLPLGQYEEKKRRLQEERKRETQEVMDKGKVNGFHVDQNRKENIPPPRPQSPEETGLIGQLGSYDQKRKKLEEERKKEYNKMLSEQELRRTGRHPQAQDNEEVGLPAMNRKMSAEARADFAKRRARNEEYRQFLEQEEQKRRHRYDSHKPADAINRSPPPKERTVTFEDTYDRDLRRDDDYDRRRDRYDDRNESTGVCFAVSFHPPFQVKHRRAPKETDYGMTLPGIRDKHSAEQRKMAERNREYNDFLQQKSERDNRRREDQRIRTRSRSDFLSDDEDAFERGRNKPPRRGWGTPTYEEILEQKRREESRYRRYDDPEYSRTPTGMRLGDDNYRRSAISDGYLNDDRRLNAIDRQYDAKRVQFKEESKWPSLLDEVYWTSPLRNPARDPLQEWDDRRRGPREPDPSPRRTHPDPEPPARQGRRGYQPPQEDDSRQAGATLLVGHENSESAKRRKQEEYRKELELQMKGDKEAKQREKEREKANDMRINVSGAQDPEKRPDRLRELPPAEQRGPPRQYQSVPVQPYHPVTEDLSPRSQAFQKYQAQLFSEPSSRPAPSILDRGWGGDLYGRPLEPGLGLLSRQPG